MDKIVIDGGAKLKGTVEISGSKNAALPIVCASLLLENEKLILNNVPHLRDINTLITLLEILGPKAKWEKETLVIESTKIKNFLAPYDIVRKMRASILVLGPLLATKGKAKVSLPGGCAIGARPIDLHLEAFKKMGATIELKGGYVEAKAPGGLKGAEIHFKKISVGATENVMLAAVLAKGLTIIHNAAMEPEVVDLAKALIAMGAEIEGINTPILRIRGVKKLHGLTYRIIPDRIEAATYLVAACATGGEVKITNCEPEHLTAAILKLQEMGAKVKVTERAVWIKGPNKIKSTDISTSEYPGFPTDLQAQFMVLNLFGDGIAIVSENIFENRFMHVQELSRMGANIRIEGGKAIVSGKIKLSGAEVMATDLRASASLIIAALVAKGKSEILRVYHLDRGYENIEKKLRQLGAKIKRVKGKSY